jgi:hypothetical protein
MIRGHEPFADRVEDLGVLVRQPFYSAPVEREREGRPAAECEQQRGRAQQPVAEDEHGEAGDHRRRQQDGGA